MIELPLNRLPAAIRHSARKIDKAAAQTLNTVAFRSLPALVQQAKRDMKIKGNARAALGWQVNRASASKLEAVIQTKRQWLESHLVEGTRGTKEGDWVYNGRAYLFAPIKPQFVARGGRLRPSIQSGIYIVPRGNDALVFYRKKRGAKESELIGVLKPRFATHEDTKPMDTIGDIWRSDATKLFKLYLRNAAFKANSKGVF